MSRSKATKRRKVWVNEYLHRVGDELGHGAFPSKKTASEGGNYNGNPVPFIERLPGDVVLSREDAKWLLSKALVTDFESADDRARTLALLRGRR